VATEPQVFFNYRRSDSGQRAERLCDALRYAFGPKQVFKDTDTIGPGSDFAVAIEEALARAELVIAVIGPTWLTVADEKGERRLDDPDDYVRRELETALDSAVPIIRSWSKAPGRRTATSCRRACADSSRTRPSFCATRGGSTGSAGH
jgi:hypothetical protein